MPVSARPPPDAASAPPDAQVSGGYAVRDQWDDPDDKRTVGSRTVRQVAYWRRADPILTMHKRDPRMVTVDHLRAVERLRDDWDKAQGLMARGVGGSGINGPTDARLDAVARVRAAHDALGGVIWMVVLCVALWGKSLTWMRAKSPIVGLPSRATAAALVEGLDRLHNHYNPPARGGDNRA